jgi:hypothetical protein
MGAMTQPAEVLFAFDHSRQALVFAGPNGQPMGIHVNGLKQAGWNVDEAELRKSLPRFDKPSIVTPGQALDARALARLNGGRR